MTDQRDALEQELKHNETEFVRLVEETMEKKLAESFDRLAFARSFAPTGFEDATNIQAVAFDRCAQLHVCACALVLVLAPE